MPDEENFKVTDRRGRSKDADRAQPEAGTSGESHPSGADFPPAGSESPPESHAAGPDLQGLFVMFASSALINLGEAGDPVTGETRLDLDQAREAIDVLLLLRDKTDGNRTEQESRLLEEILYDVQMRFVRAAQARGSG